MTLKKNVTLLFVSLLLLMPSLSSATDVHMSVAASMTDAVKTLTDQFSRSHPDITIRLNLGSSGALARQIDQGAPADLYISANTKWMDHLIETKRIDSQAVRILAKNRLVFIGGKGLNVASLTDLTGLSRIALGSPQSVPAGQYAMDALTAVGIYQDLLARNVLVMTKDVRQALLYADRGETDGAFVYATDALLAETAVVLITVPSDLHAPIVYPMALTVEGKEKAEARVVFEFLTGPVARSALTSFGFDAPEGNTAATP
ncbi:molybdate ABC transporter substrate-binding protein [Desulfatiferula olefinivorans]